MFTPEEPMNEQEQWRPVTLPEFTEFYEVSIFGQVRKTHSKMPLRASPTGLHNHLQLKLRIPNGQTKNVMLAHLVLAAFGEDPCGRPVGYHDQNSLNCRLSNLFLLSGAAANGNGHTKQMLAVSVEKLSALLWEELLPETLPDLAEHRACPLYQQEIN